MPFKFVLPFFLEFSILRLFSQLMTSHSESLYTCLYMSECPEMTFKTHQERKYSHLLPCTALMHTCKVLIWLLSVGTCTPL